MSDVHHALHGPRCGPVSSTADEGGREVADMLHYNQTIKKLLLSSNLLGREVLVFW